jgi:hypothetical protein
MSLPIPVMPNHRSRSRFRPGSRCLPPVRTEATLPRSHRFALEIRGTRRPADSDTVDY